MEGKLRPVESDTTVETSSIDNASDGSEREPEPTVDGYAAAIEPYAFSNADGDVDHAVALRGGASESAPCEPEDTDGVA